MEDFADRSARFKYDFTTRDHDLFKMKKLFILICLFTFTSLFACAQAIAIKSRIANHELFVPVRLAAAPGDTLNFMFDSGAGTILMDSAAARRLHVTPSSGHDVIGAGGTAAMNAANDLSLLVGSIRLNGITAVISDLSGISAIMGLRMDGIIGYDILKRYPRAIDMDRQQIVIYPEQRDLPQQKGSPLSFIFFPQIPFLPEVRANFTASNGRTYTGDYLLDTGAGLTALLNTPYIEAESLDALPGKRMTVRTEGVTGLSERTITRITSFAFSGFRFNNLPVQQARTHGGISAIAGIAGLLGNELLYRFNLLFDYPGRAIYLTPNRQYRTPVEFPLCGFQLKTDGQHLWITHLVAESPEAAAGMQENEEVLRINGKPALSLIQARALLKQTGKVVHLTLRQHGHVSQIAVKLFPRV